MRRKPSALIPAPPRGRRDGGAPYFQGGQGAATKAARCAGSGACTFGTASGRRRRAAAPNVETLPPGARAAQNCSRRARMLNVSSAENLLSPKKSASRSRTSRPARAGKRCRTGVSAPRPQVSGPKSQVCLWGKSRLFAPQVRLSQHPPGGQSPNYEQPGFGNEVATLRADNDPFHTRGGRCPGLSPRFSFCHSSENPESDIMGEVTQCWEFIVGQAGFRCQVDPGLPAWRLKPDT